MKVPVFDGFIQAVLIIIQQVKIANGQETLHAIKSIHVSIVQFMRKLVIHFHILEMIFLQELKYSLKNEFFFISIIRFLVKSKPQIGQQARQGGDDPNFHGRRFHYMRAGARLFSLIGYQGTR